MTYPYVFIHCESLELRKCAREQQNVFFSYHTKILDPKININLRFIRIICYISNCISHKCTTRLYITIKSSLVGILAVCPQLKIFIVDFSRVISTNQMATVSDSKQFPDFNNYLTHILYNITIYRVRVYTRMIPNRAMLVCTKKVIVHCIYTIHTRKNILINIYICIYIV